ncbi:enoyl-CoA hydratase/isomerase family protein [Halomarina ordinaria]|uniref:Enoyl-CoA hydratase/isomerase family protein n=1 Tax=Halomarina ordinaria TaxID=3033939 RepID=A0ABD5UD65_9EURY|nr:enoyl-CoA hydratase-related protein [Halomarina sp. PSRA2]
MPYDYENFRVEREGDVLRVAIDSTSKMNALNRTMTDELLDLAVSLHGDDVRCLALTGSDGVFCAGGDVAGFAADADPSTEMRRGASLLHDAVVHLRRAEVPVVTGVNGPAVGAGLSLAILGDVVLAGEGSYFQFGYPRIGLTGDGGSTYFLPRLLGLRGALDFALRNRRVAAAEAVEMGLATDLVAADALDDELTAVSEALAAGPTVALGRTRQLLAESFERGFEAHLAAEADTIARTARTADFEEGVRSFTEGRDPAFEGR